MYSIIEKVILLQDIDVFKDVRIEDLTHLATIAEEVTFKQGTNLYEMNDSADCLFLVLYGKVRLHRDCQELGISGARQAFDTWSLFDNQPRLATATAIEETEVLRISRDDFYDLLSDNVRIAEAMLKSLARRLRLLSEII